ncbi:MAG: hypothetical protein ACYC2O_13355 [Microthrixaceae bacterium]
MLRRRDPVARQVALATLSGWHGADLTPAAARAVLDATTGIYPPATHDTSHPAELLTRLLWGAPHSVPVGEVLRVYAAAGERARRALLHLLALRRDDQAMSGLEYLLGAEGPTDLLPIPTSPLLDPLLDHPDVTRLVPLLVALAPRRGWTWHVAGLLGELHARGRLGIENRARVIAGMGPLVAAAVDTCDRLWFRSPPGAAEHDSSRADRERLGALTRLLVALPDDATLESMWRMLAAADPRVSVLGAVALVQRRQAVGPDRIALLARDPSTLLQLHRGLEAADAVCLIPERHLEPEVLACSQLVHWLSGVTELGRAPDEIEPVASRQVRVEGADDGLGGTSGVYDAEVHLFRFRMRAPHWSHARGWMIGTAGEWTYSCYAAEDEHSLEDHIESVRLAATQWPDPPGPDGPA